VFAVLLGAPIAGGAHRGWPLAVAQLALLTALVLWVASMASARRLEWRRTALDLPLGLLIALVLAQLAVGHGALVAWALAPSAADPAAPVALPALLLVGTVSPAQTARSLRLFLTYAAVYVLVVNLISTRRALDRLVNALLLLGSVLSFLALLDYLAGHAWLLRWSEAGSAGRLSATFVNPDHWAAWLELLIPLGVGDVLARARPRGAGPESLRSREGRERLARRCLPMIGIAVMALALVFTLSRGGILSIAAALAALLAVEGARGRARASLVIVGSVLALTAAYGAWIGFGPLLARLGGDQYGGRLAQLVSTVDMLKSFPLLGVGLGAYRDIYTHYQPAELAPGRLYFPYAHNDLLQVAVELGLLGAAACVFAAWRVGRDLLGAHLLGRGRCPVGGGEDEGARRRDGWSAGIGLGALAGVIALLVHSAFDFAARIPANGMLAAACLGIATTALHTRFGRAGDRLLTAVRAVPLGGRLARVAVGAAVLAALACVPAIARAPVVEWMLASAAPAAVRVERALAVAPRDAEARWARARLRLAIARQVWDSGQTPDGRILASWAERRREALLAFEGAIEDARVALSARPSDPFLHETLARAHGDAAAIDEAGRARHQAAAFTALQRAIALAPRNAYLHRSLVAVALGQPEPVLPVALGAARAAIGQDPSLLPGLAGRFLPLGLEPAQWAALVPDAPVDRLELGLLLDGAGLAAPAEDELRRAGALSPPGAGAFARWALARSLLRRGETGRALEELDAALDAEPDNPELQLLRARILAGRGDPAALGAYRAAVASAEERAARPGADALPFRAAGSRARGIVSAALPDAGQGPARYRRALAEYLGERQLWDQAAREWERVRAELPGDAGVHHARAVALQHAGAEAEALEGFRRAVALDGRTVRFRMALARSLWGSGQYFQAINEWRAALGHEPGNLDARLALAHAYVRTGDRPAAAAEYRRVLDLAPDNAEARQALGRLAPRG
jgi:Tfp pilus assembly protein PilF/O-antigen ligase